MLTVIVSRGIPTKEFPLNGIFEFDQAKALSNTDAKIVLLGVDLRSIRRKRKYGLQSYKIDNLDIISLSIPIGNIPKFLLRPLRRHLLRRVLTRIKKRYGRIDVVHSHFYENNLACTAVKMKDVKFFSTLHSSTINNGAKSKSLKRGLERIERHCVKVFSVSPNFKETLKRKYGINTIYIPNLVDTKDFCIKDVQTRNNSKIRFVSTARLEKIKNMDYLIEVFEALNANLNIELNIIGNGSESEKIQELINKKGLDNRIIMHGGRERAYVAEFYKNCDVFVLLSKSETFGVVYIEALASGLPVISTRCGGPEHFINESNGIFVDFDDVESSKKAIETFIDEIDKYNRNEISSTIKQLYSPEVIVEVLMSFYRGKNYV